MALIVLKKNPDHTKDELLVLSGVGLVLGTLPKTAIGIALLLLNNNEKTKAIWFVRKLNSGMGLLEAKLTVEALEFSNVNNEPIRYGFDDFLSVSSFVRNSK